MDAKQLNDYQRSGQFHPFTCRICRGMGECPRRDVGLTPERDHHVLEAVDHGDAIQLHCHCCGHVQVATDRMLRVAEICADSGPWWLQRRIRG